MIQPFRQNKDELPPDEQGNRNSYTLNTTVSDILTFSTTQDWSIVLVATLVKRRRARKDSIQQILTAEPRISDQITMPFRCSGCTPTAAFLYIDRKPSSYVTCQELKRNRLEKKGRNEATGDEGTCRPQNFKFSLISRSDPVSSQKLVSMQTRRNEVPMGMFPFAWQLPSMVSKPCQQPTSCAQYQLVLGWNIF